MNALQTGGKLVIKPTKAQSGGFLGSLLAAVDIPLLVKALGGNLQNRPYSAASMNYKIPITKAPKTSKSKG